MMTAEEQRLEQDRNRQAYWRRWGPYVSDRQWGKVPAPMAMHGHTCRTTIIFSILQEAIAISPNNKYSRVILYVLDCDHLNPLHLICYLSLFEL